ncbi:hypothetical protein [Mycobacterium montefiorense]|uniref:Uncharacterized protein n=1 Tax=Mycobacterium montefiorense TaxID=154654 RepID=A0AA37UYQ3_9MYCO|nr:hypothetical protein [Mycobacterium montefiorense]GBG37826.1 hypothetical protein MmonteBS_21980 [Mycobacterium montefiorense]GKU34964.1 hypothetical protein NJB14191_23100 [Mycobacterium montefiorense]GKU40977.1 hypothetical protein NJB14192_29630 [Mycobacterium montefiorense]GKU47086.1 hypothetical protein NJB14194_37040 [Mycobacterium montefiorense]GKU49206.1 hypothetical protein NJB14195_04530 [Mycobacterium montefiorense]
MTFVVVHRINGRGMLRGRATLRGRSMLRAGRLLTNRLSAMHIPTPEERANLYASLTPIGVLSAAPGAAPSGSAVNYR